MGVVCYRWEEGGLSVWLWYWLWYCVRFNDLAWCVSVCLSQEVHNLPCSKMQSCYLYLPILWSNFTHGVCLGVIVCCGIPALLSAVEVEKVPQCLITHKPIETHTRLVWSINSDSPSRCNWHWSTFVNVTVIIQVIFIQHGPLLCPGFPPVVFHTRLRSLTSAKLHYFPPKKSSQWKTVDSVWVKLHKWEMGFVPLLQKTTGHLKHSFVCFSEGAGFQLQSYLPRPLIPH